jgi:hypothetical protein
MKTKTQIKSTLKLLNFKTKTKIRIITSRNSNFNLKKSRKLINQRMSKYNNNQRPWARVKHLMSLRTRKKRRSKSSLRRSISLRTLLTS